MTESVEVSPKVFLANLIDEMIGILFDTYNNEEKRSKYLKFENAEVGIIFHQFALDILKNLGLLKKEIDKLDEDEARALLSKILLNATVLEKSFEVIIDRLENYLDRKADSKRSGVDLVY